MLIVRCISTVVVTDRSHTCQRGESIINVSCILFLIIVYIYLVSCGKEEVNIHIILNRIQCLIPSLNILRCAAGADLRVSHKCKAEGGIIISCREAVYFADCISVYNTVYILCILFQS